MKKNIAERQNASNAGQNVSKKNILFRVSPQPPFVNVVEPDLGAQSPPQLQRSAEN